MILKRFSLTGLYGKNLGARIIDVILLVLLCVLIIAAPLPFGSVEPRSIFLIEIVAAVCFFVWIVKLVFCSESDQLAGFQAFHRQEKDVYSRAPFFQKHPLIRFLCRVVTLGSYPRRFEATILVGDASPPA